MKAETALGSPVPSLVICEGACGLPLTLVSVSEYTL